ncbi:GNAT family N-acetyltransferase [Humibacter sp. RRB41]|uniref:GNAT family N-acetyltransferase n=1 Tax=Humibacter sp. RRB41 TaxID=2919946 RepID=UPI001FA9BF50|nr:GNAT family N-acetyltransferase [Humibacter sp. RRB41]
MADLLVNGSTRRGDHVSARGGYRTVVEDRPFAAFRDGLDELTSGHDETDRLVYRLLAEPTSVAKRNVLVLRGGTPVLAATFRARAGGFEIATTNCAARLEPPHRLGHLDAALAATRLSIVISETEIVPAAFPSAQVSAHQWYGADLQDFDFERHWRSSGVLKELRQTIKRRPELGVQNGDLTSLEWTVAQWRSRWASHEADETGVTDDLLVIWPELLARGRIIVTALVDSDGEPIAGQVSNVDDGFVTAAITARDLGVHGVSLGTRVLIENISSSKREGHTFFDLGGYFDQYKRRFLPAVGERWTVQYTPRSKVLSRDWSRRKLGGAMRAIGLDPAVLRRHFGGPDGR